MQRKIMTYSSKQILPKCGTLQTSGNYNNVSKYASAENVKEIVFW
jgi:hypothetical protein